MIGKARTIRMACAVEFYGSSWSCCRWNAALKVDRSALGRLFAANAV